MRLCKKVREGRHKFQSVYNPLTMKTTKSKNKIFAALITVSFLLQGCSTKSVKIGTEVPQTGNETSVYRTFPLMGYNNFTPVNRYSLMPRYQNFTNKQYPKQSFLIANMIAVVQPEMNEEKRDEMASMIAKVSRKYNIKPEIFVSIIDTESNFKMDMVSSTGDLSLAQINVDVWNKEFARMGLPVIDRIRVVTDLEYSLSFMAEILSVLKTRFAESDPVWFARYHSNTPKYKNDYYQKLSFRMELIERSENLRNQIAQIQNLELLAVEADKTMLAILSPEPMSTPELSTANLMSPAQTKGDKAIEYAKNFVFDVIKL